MNVHVVSSNSCETLCRQEGWNVTSLEEADAVMLPGGADISPSLYDQIAHQQTYASPGRDAKELEVYHKAIEHKIPLIGICRGAQLLNVMSGGSMYQHVNNHGGFTDHAVVDIRNGSMRTVNSLHHQMMIPGEEAEVIAVASEATRVEYMRGDEIVVQEQDRGEDMEVIWYPNTQSLCFQGHPEMAGADSDCRKYFVELVTEFIGDIKAQDSQQEAA